MKSVLFSFLASDTPLGVACGRNGNIQCIMPLLSGGAHIDFRGKDGLTPMHRAAIGGNALAVNVSTLDNVVCVLVIFDCCGVLVGLMR